MKKNNTKKIPLSVFIIAKDEENRIATAINSVIDFADEVFVVEYGSSDNTIKIAKECGATVVQNKWEGFGQQKRFGEDLCKNDWVFNLDADEEVSLELANEIKSMFENKTINNFIGYRNKSVLMLAYEKKPRLFAHYRWWIRLYNKKKARFQNHSTYDIVVINGEKPGSKKEKTMINKLNKVVYHRSMLSSHQGMIKINRYTSMLAKECLERNKSYSIISMLLIMPIAFIKRFFITRFFIYGVDGFFISTIYAFSRLLKYYKVRELTLFKKTKGK